MIRSASWHTLGSYNFRPFSTTGPHSIIPLSECRRFVIDCMRAVGTTEDGHAEALADLLIEADYRGHYSHGMNRLEIYVDDVKNGSCDPNIAPVVLKETAATGWIDGRNGLGAAVGNFSMDLAIRKAKEVGVGWAALGTNALSLAAPASTSSDNFVLDMATTAVAVGKVEMQMRKEQAIPEGWALDADGHITTDAHVAYKTGRLMPLGGSELNSGYKGYGLAMLVEIFCGMLSASNFGGNIRRWGDSTTVANLGQCFIAVDPNCFAPGFGDRLSDLVDMMRNLEPVDPELPVLVPGDPERQHMDLVDQIGGVRYVKNQLDACNNLANKLHVKSLQTK